MEPERSDPVRGSSHSEEERAFLQQRMALQWRVVFIVGLAANILGVALDPPSWTRLGDILNRVATLCFALLWLFCRRGHRSWRTLLGVEWGGMALVVAVMALMGRYLTAEAIDHFLSEAPGAVVSLALAKSTDAYVSMSTLFGAGLMLALRAALVPSPPRRTLALTAALGVPLVAIPLLLAPASAGLPALRMAHRPWLGALTYSIWWTIVTVSTTVISHVVFGLRAEMRRARRLGQYTIEAKIGEGGMGVVYRAHHGMMRRPSAIKLLRPEKAVAANLKRFEREVQLTARLTHPHTITLFDYGRTAEGVFYYAMELLDGASLERVVAVAGRLAPARVIRVLHQVAGALVEAHEVGLVHRDIKPANIILCRYGGLYDFAKVVDFGLVKDLEVGGEAALTHADFIAGTPLYLAPEAVASTEPVGPASDLYALGAVGYFALTGQNVFVGRSLVEVCAHHLHSAPEPPSRRLGEPVPGDLERLLLKCLEKDPARRPADARDLRRLLEGCADFGRWTDDDARTWWQANGAAVAPATGITTDEGLTLTRVDNPA